MGLCHLPITLFSREHRAYLRVREHRHLPARHQIRPMSRSSRISRANSSSLSHMEIHTGGFSSDEDFQQVSTGSEPTSLGLGSALRHDTALAVAQNKLHVITRGQRDWRRSISAPGSGGTGAWLEDLSAPLQDWASSLSRTISEGVAAIAEEFSGWSSGGSPTEQPTTPKANSVGSAASSPESARHRRSFTAQSPLPHPASCHDYFQPQEPHLPDVPYEKKDK